jgi:hypothetical protein
MAASRLASAALAWPSRYACSAARYKPAASSSSDERLSARAVAGAAPTGADGARRESTQASAAEIATKSATPAATESRRSPPGGPGFGAVSAFASGAAGGIGTTLTIAASSDAIDAARSNDVSLARSMRDAHAPSHAFSRSTALARSPQAWRSRARCSGDAEASGTSNPSTLAVWSSPTKTFSWRSAPCATPVPWAAARPRATSATHRPRSDGVDVGRRDLRSTPAGSIAT